jgi:lipoprotein LpqS
MARRNGVALHYTPTGYTVGGVKARRVVWMRAAVAAVVLTWVLALVGAQCAFPHFQPHAAHPSHALAVSPGSRGGEFAINVDHAHLSGNSTPRCPDQFATAVLPRSAIPAVAPAAVLGVAVISAVVIHLVVPSGRGPPAEQAPARAGQDLLTRLCLARR